MRRAIAIALLLAALPAAAEVQLQSVSWQQTASTKGAKPADVSQLALPAGSAVKGHLRARVKLLNRGQAVEGVLLQYALTAELAPEDTAGAKPQWAIPFALDERRVPKIGPNEYLDVSVDPTQALTIYLRRVHREGYWPTQLKIQVMLTPRKGAGVMQVVDSTLPVGAAQ